MSKDKRFLITGGAGFIGSELVRQAAASGAEIIIVDNLINGKKENVEDVLSEKVRLEIVDIRDTDNMKRSLKGIDIIFHLACLGVRHSIHSPRENHDVNATATLDLLRISKESGVKRFVYCSSSEVYGTAAWVPMTEECPAFPHTVYGASKLAGDCYTRAFWKNYNYPTVVVRPFNAYGPRSHHEGDSGEVIPKFLLRAICGKPMIVFGNGSQTRDFTYVSDIAKGILMAGLSDEAIGETFNIGQGEEISINDIAHTIREIIGKEDAPIERIEPRPGDVLRLYSDITKAKKILGFKPVVSLRKGLEELKQWYESRKVSIESLLRQERIRNWQKVESDHNIEG